MSNSPYITKYKKKKKGIKGGKLHENKYIGYEKKVWDIEMLARSI